MNSRAWMALTLALGACGGEKRAAPNPAPPTPAAAVPAVAPRFAWAGQFREGLARVYDDSTHSWGYVDTAGALIIPLRYGGAGDFDRGAAPVQDTLGYALIDRIGRVVERFPADSAVGGEGAVPPPSDTCSSLDGYVAELARSVPAARFSLDFDPRPTESQGSAVVWRLRNGVRYFDEHADDTWSFLVILPGVSAERARAWLLRIRHGKPLDTAEDCEEHWEVKAVHGGALLHDSGGC